MAGGLEQDHYLSVRPLRDSDYKEWPEVRYINSYAVFCEYLSKVVCVFGILIFTWSTVVLLGGFVSMLDNTDFWCITVITLCQTKEAAGAITNYGYSAFSGGTLFTGAFIKGEAPEGWRHPLMLGFTVMSVVVHLFKFLVLITIIFPLLIIFVLGVHISTGISTFRLLSRLHLTGLDIKAGRAVAGANLRPALDLLYLACYVQGLLFMYERAFLSTQHKVLKMVAKSYQFTDIQLLREYMIQTSVRCRQDPSSVRGRNLVTHAVGLIESAPLFTHSFLNGVGTLDKLIQFQLQDNSTAIDHDQGKINKIKLKGQQAKLMRQMVIGSTSSADILGRLLETVRLSPARYNQWDFREPRANAARIVAYFAGDICLSKLPGGIECISSMLQLSATALDKAMVIQGLRILQSLTAHNDNCRVMSESEGLLTRIMAPISSNLLHLFEHQEWSDVVEASMNLVSRLVVAPGVTGVKLRCEISSNTEAITTMESILECNECRPALRKAVIEILAQLSMDTSSSMSTGSREKLVKSLVGIFTDGNKDITVRKSVRQALEMLSAKIESNAVFILQANGNVVGVLKDMLVHSEENQSRISAAEILSHICSHYTKDDEYLVELKKAMKDVMPEVLRQILHCGATGGQIEKGAEANQTRFSPPATVDIENQDNGNDRNTYTSSHQRNSGQPMAMELLASFLSLTAIIFEVSQARDLIQLIDAVAPRDDGSTFAGKLLGMVQRNIVVDGDHEPTANYLRIMKTTTKVVISMRRHSGNSFTKEDNEDLESLIYYLNSHSTSMNKLEGVMSLADSNHGAKQPFKSLSSLVKEAKELWDKKKEQANSVDRFHTV